jgi:membrane dipeptidase
MPSSIRFCEVASVILAVGWFGGWFPSSICAVSHAQEGTDRFAVSANAQGIHDRGFVFDGHNDLPWEIRTNAPRAFDEIDLRLPQPQMHTDIDRLRRGNVGAQFWSVYVPVDTIGRGTAFQTTVEQIRLVHDMIARYPDVFEVALNAEDVERARSRGKIASLIGMEGGHSMEGSIGKLRQLHAMGARYMTLTHTDSLEWADSATDAPRSDGLSAFGHGGRQQVSGDYRIAMPPRIQ